MSFLVSNAMILTQSNIAYSQDPKLHKISHNTIKSAHSQLHKISYGIITIILGIDL
jgi:hypothetical protein